MTEKKENTIMTPYKWPVMMSAEWYFLSFLSLFNPGGKFQFHIIPHHLVKCVSINPNPNPNRQSKCKSKSSIHESKSKSQ
jgi:hypothetical protein